MALTLHVHVQGKQSPSLPGLRATSSAWPFPLAGLLTRVQREWAWWRNRSPWRLAWAPGGCGRRPPSTVKALGLWTQARPVCSCPSSALPELCAALGTLAVVGLRGQARGPPLVLGQPSTLEVYGVSLCPALLRCTTLLGAPEASGTRPRQPRTGTRSIFQVLLVTSRGYCCRCDLQLGRQGQGQPVRAVGAGSEGVGG